MLPLAFRSLQDIGRPNIKNEAGYTNEIADCIDPIDEGEEGQQRQLSPISLLQEHHGEDGCRGNGDTNVPESAGESWAEDDRSHDDRQRLEQGPD
jgi:hypothetical protein